jgi:ketosteroid isomerase-like protein
MSQENVEIVRRYYEAARRFFDAYWKNPRSLASALETEDFPEGTAVLSYLHPEVECKPGASALLGGTVRGHLGMARMWDEFLAAADDYVVTLGELVDIGDDQVLAVVEWSFRGKLSEMSLDARGFVLYTLRGGMITREEAYLDRKDALEAVSHWKKLGDVARDR